MAVISPYDDLTPESIKADMLADLTVKGAGVDVREGSYANTLLSEAAYQLYKLYQQLPGLLSMVFPDADAGEYIDKNAAQIGMTRSAGRRAAVTVTFTGTDGTLIPAGTTLYAPESGLSFVTTEDAVIAGGQAEAQAQAAQEGAEYNLPAGALTSLYVNVAGVLSVRNDEAAHGGADPESDAELYARYHARRALPITSGNANHYVSWATEVPGVGYASCIPLWNGNGTVKVVIAGADRGPADESVRAACAAHIEENRPIGATVTVVSVTERPVSLTACVMLAEGYTAQQVTAQLRAAVSGLLAARSFGVDGSVPYSRFLACLLQCPGVADYKTFTVDGGTAAVTFNAEDAPTAGSISVTTA